LERKKERGWERERERGVTLRRGGREMGEAMDRPKTAYAAGVLLVFKILATLHPGRDEGASDQTNGPRSCISTLHAG
jgi:hypothetical protein